MGFINWLIMRIKSKQAAKIGGGLLGGGSVFGIVPYLHGDISADIAQAEERSKKYAEIKYESTQTEIEVLKDGQKLILRAIEKLDDRVYRLNQKNNP